jgi:hypothetical protein
MSDESHSSSHDSSPHDIQGAEEVTAYQPSREWHCISHCGILQLIGHSASPAVPKDWLAIDMMQRKRVKARISGFTPQINSGARIRDGDVVTTTGKPVQVSGALPEIEVKAMVPGARVMSIPSRFLEPIHPGSIQEEVIIISGEHSGKLAIVGSMAAPLWEVLVIDGEEGTTPIVVTTPQENLVKTTKPAFRHLTR